MPRIAWWRSLRTKIMAWSFIPTAIILVAVALVTFYAYQKVTEDLVMGRNRELARLSASQLASTMGDHTGVLTALARNSEIQSSDPTAVRAGLARAANRLVVFDGGVLILNSRGTVLAAEPERPEVLGQDWSNRSYFRQMIRSRETVFSDIVPDGAQGAKVVAIAVPIMSPEDEFLGEMVGMFRIGATTVSSFYGDIVKLRIEDNSNAYLVDGNGLVIYHSDTTRVGDDISSQPVVQQVLAGKVDVIRTRGLDNRNILASFAPVPGTNWGLVTEQDWVALMRSSQPYTQFLLLLLAMGVLLPALVVTFGVRRITQPIADLICAAQEVAGGKFGHKITVRTRDELKELADQFNLMSAELQESYTYLERRVTDRTKELATLNAIAAVVSQSLDLEEVLGAALDKTMETMDMECGGAYLLQNGANSLALVTHRGLSEEFVDFVHGMPLAGGAAGQAALASQPVVIHVADYPEGKLKDLVQRHGLAQVMSVPLMAKGRVAGAINLSTRTPRPVTDEEIALLAAIGQQVGMAVENARLYEKAEESAAAAERNRLARDLHDAVSQTLFSASLIAEVLPRIWERNNAEGQRRLEELRQLTRGALAEMRTLLLELRPATLTEAALGELLRQLSEAMTGRARVPVALEVEGEAELPTDVKIALYRIAQESLSNIFKHAGASHVEISLHCEPGKAALCVADDGRGFDVTQIPPDHLGVGIMRERAESSSIRLSIDSQVGKGTTVSAAWQA